MRLSFSLICGGWVTSRALITRSGLADSPEPASGSRSGIPEAVWITMSSAFRDPFALGLKLSQTVQVLPGSRVKAEHSSLITRKSPGLNPLRPILVIRNGAPPVFFKNTDRTGVVEPTVYGSKSSLTGLRPSLGARVAVGVIGVGLGVVGVGLGGTGVGLGGTGVGLGGTGVGLDDMDVGLGGTGVGSIGKDAGVSNPAVGLGGTDVGVSGAGVALTGPVVGVTVTKTKLD